MKKISTAYGSGKYRIQLEAHFTDGHGMTVFIIGGELPHLGGVALAVPGTVLHGKKLSSCDLWTLTVPGHKDVELAQKIAKIVCLATKEPISVSAGIHVDKASGKEVELLYNNSIKTVDLFLEEYLGSATRTK